MSTPQRLGPVAAFSEHRISARGVRRSFGNVHAVRDVTFEALPGRVTGLVGPNGSGKTTLLLMLASLLAPDAGELRIGDIDPVADPQGVRRVLGWMPDALGAWPALTARETLVTSGMLYDLRRSDAQARAAELLALVELDDLADAPARVLSRGQKQKLGLARALVHDPSILLLDEPASGLDPQARITLRTLLRRFAAEGRTVLISSHILSELEEVVDDAVFLLAGSTVAGASVNGAPREWRVRIADVDATTDSFGPDAIVERISAALDIPASAVRVDRRDVLLIFASEQAAAAGLGQIVGAGIPVVEFAPVVGALEHAFLDLRNRTIEGSQS